MAWFSLFFEPLVVIGVSLILVVVLNKVNIRVSYLIKLLYAVIGFYLLVATPLGANYLVSRVEVKDIDNRCLSLNTKTVVILGGGVSGHVNTKKEIWRLKEASYRRTLSGLKLANSIYGSRIILSGGFGGRFTEADLMASLITKIGYGGRIIKDTESLNTYTSAINVTQILLNKKIESYWLVTSALHMYRAERVFIKQGIKPCRFPVNSKYIETQLPGALIPQISALDKSTAVFHEVLGQIWYLLSGKN